MENSSHQAQGACLSLWRIGSKSPRLAQRPLEAWTDWRDWPASIAADIGGVEALLQHSKDYSGPPLDIPAKKKKPRPMPLLIHGNPQKHGPLALTRNGYFPEAKLKHLRHRALADRNR